MTSLGAALACAAGGGLLASAAVDALDGLRARMGRGSPTRTQSAAAIDGATPSKPGALRAAIAWAGRRYDSSRPGMRLAARLDAASVHAAPSCWRAGQAGAFVPLSLLVGMSVGSALWAASISLSAVRIGGRLLLRARRHRRDDELEALAATLARHLATELVSGATPSEALASLAATEDARRASRLAALLVSVGMRTAVGEGAVAALQHAVDELPAGPGRDVLAVLATDLELVVERGCGTAVLTRLANGIDERRHTRAEVRAATAEIRMAALAIPSLTALCALGLVAVDPAVGVAATSPVGAVTFAVLGALAAGATFVARRLTGPPELG